jgi:hypothetical protein
MRRSVFKVVRGSGGGMGTFVAILVSLAAIFVMSIVGSAAADDRKTSDKTLLSSGTYTAATGYSTAVDVSAYTEGQIFINVTAEADTSTLDITVQVSPDNSVWYTHTAVGQITATGQTRAAITNFGKWIRIKYVVGGTSFTYSVTGGFKN